MRKELAGLGLRQAALDLREKDQPLDSVFERRVRREFGDGGKHPLREFSGTGPVRHSWPWGLSPEASQESGDGQLG